jgi:hypothetical protein
MNQKKSGTKAKTTNVGRLKKPNAQMTEIGKKYLKLWPDETRKKGCQIFLVTTHQNGEKYIKTRENVPNGHTIYQHLPLQDPPKITLIKVFGFKICHQATLLISCHALLEKSSLLSHNIKLQIWVGGPKNCRTKTYSKVYGLTVRGLSQRPNHSVRPAARQHWRYNSRS